MLDATTPKQVGDRRHYLVVNADEPCRAGAEEDTDPSSSERSRHSLPIAAGAARLLLVHDVTARGARRVNSSRAPNDDPMLGGRYSA
jgi:hypothetical protein